MAALEPLKSVYSYYFPEVRQIISDVVRNYPHDVFLSSINPGLDNFHEPVIGAYMDTFHEQMPGLSSFPYHYATAGASEGIFHLLAKTAAFEKDKPIYVLPGEYEGYAGYGKNLGLDFTTVDLDQPWNKLPKGKVFISNPSARDGNIIPSKKITAIGEAGHEIVLDATYVGLTSPQKFIVDHPAVSSVLVSLSKPYGLYYYRVGFLFSRQIIRTLEPNRWFKGILPLIIAKEVLTKFKASELANRYRGFQENAVKQLTKDFRISVSPSDALLLASTRETNLPKTARRRLAIYKRGTSYRFCLTPYFLVQERGFV